MFIKVKNMPKLGLLKLLERRKMTLRNFLEEYGIQTYETLVGRCQAIGVQPPSMSEYERVALKPASSPQDGVVVIEPLPVIDERTGGVIDVEAGIVEPGIDVVIEEPASDIMGNVSKKKKKKRDHNDPGFEF